ncbi:hypothetical protein BDZ89DRAFT_699421 [Hymenopellis radicata]|nr:hypothetical protein BDZ89DRAFT_699421 [Hymenopellis radicata]
MVKRLASSLFPGILFYGQFFFILGSICQYVTPRYFGIKTNASVRYSYLRHFSRFP